MQKIAKNLKGFTILELLITIAIVAILSVVVFVALDPLTRFKDARDSSRWTNATAILSAIKIQQVDNKGFYLSSINAIPAASSTWVYMITTNGNTTNCNSNNAYCRTAVTASSSCVDLSGLVTAGYLANLPIGPNGSGSWNASSTGYTLQKNSNGTITIRACEGENTASEISAAQ